MWNLETREVQEIQLELRVHNQVTDRKAWMEVVVNVLVDSCSRRVIKIWDLGFVRA